MSGKKLADVLWLVRDASQTLALGAESRTRRGPAGSRYGQVLTQGFESRVLERGCETEEVVRTQGGSKL